MRRVKTTLSSAVELHGNDFVEAAVGPHFGRNPRIFEFKWPCGAAAEGQGADSLTMAENCSVHKRKRERRPRSVAKE